MPRKEPDVVVVGGGILGLFVAMLLAEAGRRVRVYVSPKSDPRTDSQRNQSWLQSGLLYPDNIEIARRLFLSGSAMHDHLGRKRPRERGLFRFASEEQAQPFLEHAEEIRLRKQVELLTDSEARDLLGIFFEQDRVHYRVPDCPFDEAGLMEDARSQARDLFCEFLEARVDLALDTGSPSGYALRVGKERYFPRETIVCAGAGTPRLLRALAISHSLVVHQSNLLVIEGNAGIRVPLLADRATGLTAVAWNATAIGPNGCIVIGDGNRRVLPEDEQDVVRRVRREEEEALLQLLPTALADELRRGHRPHRFTAGHKTDFSGSGRTRVASWIHRPVHLPGLIFAVPGKATLSFEVAQSIVATLPRPELDLGSPAPTPGSGPPTGSGSGGAPPAWGDPIRPHHHGAYRDLDERERDTTHEREGRSEDVEREENNQAADQARPGGRRAGG